MRWAQTDAMASLARLACFLCALVATIGLCWRLMARQTEATIRLRLANRVLGYFALVGRRVTRRTVFGRPVRRDGVFGFRSQPRDRLTLQVLKVRIEMTSPAEGHHRGLHFWSDLMALEADRRA